MTTVYWTIAPEFGDPSIREVILAPYRVVYRIVSGEEVHVLVIHHAARGELNRL